MCIMRETEHSQMLNLHDRRASYDVPQPIKKQDFATSDDTKDAVWI